MKVFTRFAALCVMAFSTICWASPGITDTTITLGMSAPFSGPNAAYGEDMRQTIAAYFGQLNKSGGINGRKLELVALDDGYETERTVANTRALINDKNVFALLSFYGSTPTTEAMNTVFGPAKVPLVGTISGADTLREPISSNPNSRFMFGRAMLMKRKPSSTSLSRLACAASPFSTKTMASAKPDWKG